MSSNVSRRKFLGLAGAAVGLGAAGYYGLNNLGQSPTTTEPGAPGALADRYTRLALPKNPQNYLPDEYVDFIRWLESVSENIAGNSIRIAIEAEVGPRSLHRNRIDFETSTGVELKLEFDIYKNNLSKCLLAVSTQSPTFDIMNIDVSQVGRFAPHILTIEHLMETYPELTYPGLNVDDFVAPVKNFTCTYPPSLGAPWNIDFNGTFTQFPQEVPLMLRFFRKDLYSEEGREVGVTWDEYLADIRHFHDPSRTKFGTVLMAAKFPSIIMEFHNWLYSFGGKLWDIKKDGHITADINSDVAVSALEHYLEVSKYAEPNSAFYGWAPAAESMSQRRAATCINLTEFASLMDIPGESYVVRQVGYARNPVGDAGASHHYSGAGLAIPKYSRNPAAAWVFIQWATVASMQLIAAMDPLALAVPTRKSVYENPNVQELVKEGTIRHFDTVKNAIDRDEINIKPGFPKWDSIEGEMLNQLNQVIRGNLSPRDALNIVQKRADDVGPFTF